MSARTTFHVRRIVAHTYSKYSAKAISTMYARDIDIIDDITAIVSDVDYDTTSVVEVRSHVVGYLKYYNDVDLLYPRDMKFVDELIDELQTQGYLECDRRNMSVRDRQFLMFGIGVIAASVFALYILVNWL